MASFRLLMISLLLLKVARANQPCIEAVCGGFGNSNGFCDNGVCTCYDGYFYSPQTGECREYKLGDECTKEKGCFDTRLECYDPSSSFECICAFSLYRAPSEFGEDTCEDRKSHNSPCQNIFLECQDTLSCIGSSCQCDSGYYYDSGPQCIRLKNFNASCGHNKECKDSMTCQNSSCQCSDPSIYYHPDQGQVCLTRKNRYSSCSDSEQCKPTLQCLSSRCNCDSDEYYHLSACHAMKNISESCTGPNQCISPLLCSNGGRCDCDDSNYYSNGQCLPRKNYGEPCASGQCNATLSCQSNTCDCKDPAILYHGGGETCIPKKDQNATCSSSIECLQPFSCEVNECGCSNMFYYNNSQCTPKGDYEEICESGKDSCLPTLTCNDTQCVCSNNYYRNGSVCQEKQNYGDHCAANGDCKETLTCSSNTCACEAPQVFYNDGGNACLPRKGQNAICSSSNECLPPFSCVSNRCGCTTTTFYNNSQCIPKGDFEEICVSGKDSCLSYLTCNDTHCVCSEDHYQDGQACRERKDWRAVCGGDECKTDMTCRSGVCDCQDNEFFNGTQCRLMTELQVHDQVISWRSVKSVSFRWIVNSFGTSVSCRITISPNGGSFIASASGGNVTDLVPGRQYNFTVDSFFPADANLAERKTSVELGTVWTLPAQPGKFNWPLSQLNSNPMTFGFMPSDGDVNLYNVNITVEGVVNITKSVNSTLLDGLFLQLGVTYGYEIVAMNGNDDMSERMVGTFVTNNALRIVVDFTHYNNVCFVICLLMFSMCDLMN